MTVARLLGLLSALTLAPACGDFRDPGDLRFARILAVRADPPWVPAGQRARIDLLVTGNDGVPVVRAPDALTPAAPQPGRAAAPAEAAQSLTWEAGAWYVQAPPPEVLAQIRQALGLPAAGEAPVPFTLAVTAAIDGQPREAEKTVWLGGAASNPTITSITIDGQMMGDQMIIGARPEHILATTADGAGHLSYAWYSAFAALERYRQPSATLKGVKVGDTGALLLVVRDDRGGVTWKLGTLQVQ